MGIGPSSATMDMPSSAFFFEHGDWALMDFCCAFSSEMMPCSIFRFRALFHLLRFMPVNMIILLSYSEEHVPIGKLELKHNYKTQGISICWFPCDEFSANFKWFLCSSYEHFNEWDDPGRVNHKPPTPTHHPSPIANYHPRPPPPPASLHPPTITDKQILFF